jgi:hypothetical protein
VFDADGHELGETSALRQPDECGEYRDVTRFHRFVPADDPRLAEAGFLVVSRGRLRRRQLLVPLSTIAAVKAGHILLAATDETSTVPAQPDPVDEAPGPPRSA